MSFAFVLCGAPPFCNPGTTVFIDFIYLKFFPNHWIHFFYFIFF